MWRARQEAPSVSALSKDTQNVTDHSSRLLSAIERHSSTNKNLATANHDEVLAALLISYSVFKVALSVDETGSDEPIFLKLSRTSE